MLFPKMLTIHIFKLIREQIIIDITSLSDVIGKSNYNYGKYGVFLAHSFSIYEGVDRGGDFCDDFISGIVTS